MGSAAPQAALLIHVWATSAPIERAAAVVSAIDASATCTAGRPRLAAKSFDPP